MKKITVKIASLLLALLMLVGCFTSCSSLGNPLLKLDKTELSENIYMLFLSRLKGNLSSAVNYGSDALKASFWDTIVSNDGKTRDDSYKAQILEECKFYVAALNLFDELGLKLPASYTEEIEQTLSDYLVGDADGSKAALNALLAPYGANYDVLKEAYLIEAKLAYLNEHLYGKGGSKIGPEIIEDYYQANYVRFKHIFFYTYTPVYEVDEDGNDIYFLDLQDKKVAYDTSAYKRRDANGKEVKDEKGDIVYENSEGKIAYDKNNGQRLPVYDTNGRVLTRKFTQEELIEVNDDATLIMEALEGHEGNYTLFDSYVENYSEDEGSLKYTNGFYMTADANYDSPEVLAAVCEMKNGEIRKVYSDYGIHIVMRYELDKTGYAKTENSDFFVNASNGYFVFIDKLMSILISERLAPEISKVWVDEERYSAISIKDLGANFYY